MLKADSEHTGKSEIRTYGASKNKNAARLVSGDFLGGCLTIVDGEHQWQVKLDYSDLICLAAVMRRWEADNDAIGKSTPAPGGAKL